MIASERPKEALIDLSKQYDDKFKYVPSLRSIWDEENERRKHLGQKEIYTIKGSNRDPKNPYEWCSSTRYKTILDNTLKKYKNEKLNFHDVFKKYENSEIRTAFQSNMKYNGKKKLLYSLASLPEETLILDNIVLFSSNSNECQSSKSYPDEISSSLRKSVNLNLSASSKNDNNSNSSNNERINRNETENGDVAHNNNINNINMNNNNEDELNEEDIYGAIDFFDTYDNDIDNEIDNDNDNNDHNNIDLKGDEKIDPNEFSMLNDEFISLSQFNNTEYNNTNNNNDNERQHKKYSGINNNDDDMIPQFDGADDNYIIIDDDDDDDDNDNVYNKQQSNDVEINKRKYNAIDSKPNNEKRKFFKGVNSKILQYNKEIKKSKNQEIISKSPPPRQQNGIIGRNKHYNSKENIIEILSDDTIISETDESLVKSDDDKPRKKSISSKKVYKSPSFKESKDKSLVNEVKQLNNKNDVYNELGKNDSLIFSLINSNDTQDNKSNEKILTNSLSNTESLSKNSNTKIQSDKYNNNNSKNEATLGEYDSFIISPTLLSMSSFSPKLKSPTVNNTDNEDQDSNDKKKYQSNCTFIIIKE